MKAYLIILFLFLCGCASFDLELDTRNAIVKSKDGQFSLYANKACYPYKNQSMVCVQGDTNTMIFYFRFVPKS